VILLYQEKIGTLFIKLVVMSCYNMKKEGNYGN
jgi:hypothetical protein